MKNIISRRISRLGFAGATFAIIASAIFGMSAVAGNIEPKVTLAKVTELFGAISVKRLPQRPDGQRRARRELRPGQRDAWRNARPHALQS